MGGQEGVRSGTRDESALGHESAVTPAMERWRERLAAGYTIRPRLRMGRKGQAYLEWGPALYNPAGAFVQNMRRDTLRKLMKLGILSEEGRRDAGEPGSSGAGMDEVNGANAAAGEPAGSGRMGGDSE